MKCEVVVYINDTACTACNNAAIPCLAEHGGNSRCSTVMKMAANMVQRSVQEVVAGLRCRATVIAHYGYVIKSMMSSESAGRTTPDNDVGYQAASAADVTSLFCQQTTQHMMPAKTTKHKSSDTGVGTGPADPAAAGPIIWPIYTSLFRHLDSITMNIIENTVTK